MAIRMWPHKFYSQNEYRERKSLSADGNKLGKINGNFVVVGFQMESNFFLFLSFQR